MDTKAGLLRLPPELTLAVVNLVEASDIESLRLTHSVLYDACLTKRKPAATFQQTSSRLSLFFADILSRVESEKPVLRAILSQLKSVSIIYISPPSGMPARVDKNDWDPAHTHQLARPCPHLRCRLVRVLRIFGSLDMCPHLKHLQLNLGDLFYLSRGQDNLNNVSFAGLKTLQFYSAVSRPPRLLSNCSNLQCLHIEAATFDEMGKTQLPSVTALRISSHFSYRIEDVHSKLLAFPNLEELAIDELAYPEFDDEQSEPVLDLQKAIVKIPSLRSLLFTIERFYVRSCVDKSVRGPYGSLCASFLKQSNNVQVVMVRARHPVAYQAQRVEDKIRVARLTVSSPIWPFRQH